MAADTGKLTVLKVKSAPLGKHFDGGGLYLHVTESGRYWRMKYRHSGKEKLLALGVFPEVSLAEARKRRDEARALLRDGTDPGQVKRQEKVANAEATANTFGAIAEEWLAKQQNMSPATLEKARWTFDSLVNPWIGNRPISEIDAPEMLKLLQRIEERGAHETAHRTKQRCGQIFRYAIATGRARHDPTADLRGALTPAKVKHRAAITGPARVGELLRAIEGYTGGLVVRTALKLAPLLFVRPGELRQAEWAEFDLDAGQWRIPASKMKMRELHIVPLPTQAVVALQELQPLTGRGRYVFPGERSRQRPMSEAAVNAALRRMGFDKDTMTGHGFRAMASTRLNEMGWSADVIERQLAHAERNKVRAAYNRAQYLAERKKMMQGWADYLDSLRVGGRVVALKTAQL
ncbi:tyrosine-type recombinase/integrase [Dyella acidiphila]|uniref:Tyrosine-type recombinase/integrase n=1 Tax=Dyella acidiphila TaxID=2775866 RepID=A0ABR9GEQ9_9GAMM|nr:integrase arm-type DNA-binding domain-containing protein [Dyella acidiphila]MBE1162525.1 tyrosine-type recombinase/integrase [Dyella acidiphila]